MKFLQYLFYGILFGVTLIKSEVASWFRIQEMFHFQSFHMYGVIGTAVVLGIIGVQIIKNTISKTSTAIELFSTTKTNRYPVI